MLTRLHLRGFKSFVDETVDLSPLTMLVGANASGKSNLLDAIQFLQGVAMDMSLVDVLRGRREGGRIVWPGIRGGIADIAHRDDSEMYVESTWSVDGETITHGLGLSLADHPLLSHEELRADGVGYLYDTGAPELAELGERPERERIRVALRDRQGKRRTQTHDASRSLLFQIGVGPRLSEEVPRVRDLLVAAMRNAYFLDITPSRMRDYVPKSMDVLGPEGENVSALAWAMCQDPEAKQDLVDWLAELCAPELKDIDFAKTDLGDVMLVLVEQGGRRIPARSLSDGTLRFLGELIALRTAPEGSLLLIEEIENGLHPTRAHLLVEAMEAATKARGIQVIATTHSPLVLNALSRDALRQAVLVARPSESKGTVLRQLGTLPDFDEVCDRRGVDRMLASGWLERAV